MSTSLSLSQVAKGVYRLEWVLGERLVGSVLVVGGRRGILVDPPDVPLVDVTRAFNDNNLTVDGIWWVVNTHFHLDHSGSNGPICSIAPRAQVLCHRDDARLAGNPGRVATLRQAEEAELGLSESGSIAPPRAPSAIVGGLPVLELAGGEHLLLEDERSVEVLHTPGHTAGSISLWDPATATAITGDAVLGSALLFANGDRGMPPTYVDVDQYENSCRVLLGLKPRLLLSAHHYVVAEPSVRPFIRESLRFAARLDELVIQELGRRTRGARSAADISESIAPRLGRWIDARVLAWPVRAHLTRLVRQGRARRSRDTRPYMWRMCR